LLLQEVPQVLVLVLILIQLEVMEDLVELLILGQQFYLEPLVVEVDLVVDQQLLWHMGLEVVELVVEVPMVH
jgi:hypothetical protein